MAFEERGRESFVPAGASSRTDRVSGPGTPRYNDAEAAFRDAVDEVDSGRDAGRKAASLRYILEHARGRDAMTLWHLISRVGPVDRAAVVDALTVRVPLPSTVSREAVLRLDRTALDRWWDALGLERGRTGGGSGRCEAPSAPARLGITGNGPVHDPSSRSTTAGTSAWSVIGTCSTCPNV